ncbi:hypothetical protein HYD78_03410 [Mycoplasmopsis bovis]|nr:hypothetical protein HYD78_03410 [Mycoplasmopsis bovis]
MCWLYLLSSYKDTIYNGQKPKATYWRSKKGICIDAQLNNLLKLAYRKFIQWQMTM